MPGSENYVFDPKRLLLIILKAYLWWILKIPNPKKKSLFTYPPKGFHSKILKFTMSQMFSREKFSELVNKISLVLTQDVETEPSDVRFTISLADLLGHNKI